MGLAIYKEISTGVYEAFSINGAQTNPITTLHDGKNGTTEEKKLYVRATDAHTYSNITVKVQSLTVEDDIGSGINPGSTGWGIKLLAQDNQPTESQWEEVNYGASISISNITDNSTYRPFWLRIESPPGETVKNKENNGLYLLFTDTP